MLKPALALLLPLLLLVAACSEDKSGPTASPTTVATALPRVDGTMAPQNPGSTEPSTIKSNPDPVRGISVLKDVRVGAHPEQGGWDRIVFEFADSRPAGRVEYRDRVDQCASGMPVPLPGTAVLFLRFDAAQAHDDAGRLTVRSTDVAGPGNVILGAKQTCDFEAVLIWAVGVRARQPYKVTLLEGPTRVVIDVKQ